MSETLIQEGADSREFACPFCDQQIECKVDQIGQPFTCPICKEHFLVPVLEPMAKPGNVSAPEAAANHLSAKSMGNKNMLVGALWCIGGIVVTAATYSAASSSSGGGTYVVAWGAILFGGLQFLKGLFQALTVRG